MSAIDRHYVVPWSIMLASLRKKNPALDVEAFLLHFDLTDEDLGYLTEIATSTAVPVHFIRVPAYPFVTFPTRRNVAISGRKKMPPIVYVKAFIDRFIPDRVRRCVLIDADVVVAGAIDELLTMPMPHSIAAVANIPRNHHHQFNTGFALVNLALWRTARLSDAAERLLFDSADALHTHDQHTLNLLVGRRWTKLHPRWNYMIDMVENSGRVTAYSAPEIEEASRAPTIIHYVMGAQKPWRSDCLHPFVAVYRSHHARLAQTRARFDLLDPQESRNG